MTKTTNRRTHVNALDPYIQKRSVVHIRHICTGMSMYSLLLTVIQLGASASVTFHYIKFGKLISEDAWF